MTATKAPVEARPGLWRDDAHRYFYADRGPLPSVTTIIGVVDKSGPLVSWAKRETAACAVRNLDLLNTMVKDGGRDAAQQWLQRIPDFQRDAAADLGTRIHALADAHSRGVDIAPTGIEVPYLRAWYRFVKAVRPELILSEALIANLTLGYGGTFDLGVLINGVPTMLDIKTGKGVYAETALQLAGYAMAEFTATEDDPTPRPLPKWEQYGVVHLQPDEWSLVPYAVTDATRAAFAAAVELHRWTKESAPWAKLTPIVIPEEAAS